jgi:hypothetical protein
MFVFKKVTIPLGSLSLLNLFILELVIMSYCLYDVFYKPVKHSSKNAESGFISCPPPYAPIPEGQPMYQVKKVELLPFIDDLVPAYYKDFITTEASFPSEFNDSAATVTITNLPNVYAYDSVDIKPEMSQIIQDIGIILDRFFTTYSNEANYSMILTYTINEDGRIKEVELSPLDSSTSLLKEQISNYLLQSKASIPAMKAGEAVPCRISVTIENEE